MSFTILSILIFLLLLFIATREMIWAEKILRIGVLVPLSGEKSMGDEVVAAAYLGADNINQDTSLRSVIAEGYSFRISVSDTGCDTGQGLQKVVELVSDLATTGHKVDGFVG
ncbi:hypothetical protein PoB_006929000 [Plakobranchus ocellatus]|uniref:Receptor ligand binding region domain-containing protein n=1 Tax=Plakobranchus ocellatus TaxID=259542 RepID=A0AAV4DFM6_9GAST|nr:hypothetical protein PoB_006929000 [Plakobranchus ocellatus]